MGFSLLPDTFNFAAPYWLWGLALLPLIWLLYALFYKSRRAEVSQLSAFADPHLLPHLLAQDGQEDGQRKNRTLWALAGWSVIWLCGMVAMAGPRWDYIEVEAFTPARNLVILLDLSRSMDAEDLQPSRLVRARQEIQDLVTAAQGVNVALIAFASVPHLITPLTDDTETMLRLLPSLTTDLVYTQGSALVPALQMAGDLLRDEQGSQDHIVIFTDGGFEDGDASILQEETRLKGQGATIDIVGMGTVQGAPVPGGSGLIKRGGQMVMTQLEEERLKRIANDGGGIYLQSDYLASDTQRLLARIGRDSGSSDKPQQKTKFWEERFYLFLIPFVLLALPWFRRNAAFPVLVLAVFMLQASPAQALDWRSLFANKEQQGKAAVEQGDYDQAADVFSDAYRRGVAQYKAGDYAAAAESFAQAGRPEIRDQARYNLGNAQLMKGDIDEAIKTYEEILKENPQHEDAQHNLQIAKQLKQQQQQQQQQNQDGDQSQSGDQDQQKDQQGDKPQQGEESQNEQQGDRQEEQDQGGSDSDQQEKQAEAEKDPDDQQGQNGKEEPEMPPQDEQEQDSGQASQDRQNEQDNDATPESAAQSPRRSQQDINADQWLNRIENDPKMFLRNKFYIESQRRGAQQGDSPW